MSVPTTPRQADTVYNRHESGGPGYAEGALWTDRVSPLISQALARPWMSRAEIRDIPNPMPQVMLFPPKHGYEQHEPTIIDVLNASRFHIPYAPVGQDGGGAIATSQPSLQTWW